MRNARRLRQELDLWKIAWQQIETFLERIDGARDQDQSHRRKLDALLRAARVVEHERAMRVDDRPLSDPVIDEMPRYWSNPTSGVQSISEPWSLDYRKWRIPGMDELELAAANLATQAEEGAPVLEKVGLPPDREIFEIRIDKNDRRYPLSQDGLLMIRLPSYPAVETGRSIAADAGLVDIAEDADTSSLFSLDARIQAATAPDETQDPVRAWSDLCASRRANLPGSQETYDQDVRYSGPSNQLCWRAYYASQTRDVVQTVLAGLGTSDPETAGTLVTLAQAARTSAAVSAADIEDLNQAVDVMSEEGAQTAGFNDQLAGAATALQGRAQSFSDFARKADRLRADLTSHEKARDLEQALEALITALNFATHPLFQETVENANGLLAPELDNTVLARLSYPDGTLRMVRALEWGFVSVWPARLRWFKTRNGSVLSPLLQRLLKPFIKSLFGLIHGADTGFACSGLELELGVPAPVGSETLTCAQPASILPALDSAVETGQVAIVEGNRPVAAVVLGLDDFHGRFSLNISPLIVSLAAEDDNAPGSPGLVPGGQPIVSQTAAPSQAALRQGKSDTSAAADGLVQQIIALWSRLCLVYGWRQVEQALQGSPAGFDQRLIADPSSARLRNLRLYGEIEANTTTLVIRNAPDAFWDRATYPAQPRLARPYEMLLLRGRGEGEEEGSTGPMCQCAVEVDSVYAATGSVVDQMETASAALLSASATPPADTCPTPCGPEEEVIVVIMRQTWQKDKLIGEITLRRDFEGFEACSLATERLLPVSFLRNILPSGTVADDGGMDRRGEFDAALKYIADWTRYAR
jgi:hypothetical protein